MGWEREVVGGGVGGELGATNRTSQKESIAIFVQVPAVIRVAFVSCMELGGLKRRLAGWGGSSGDAGKWG